MSNPQNPGNWESQPPPPSQQPYGTPPPNYGQAPYGTPPQNYGQPPYGAPPPGQYGVPPQQYQQPYMPQSTYQPMYPVTAPVETAPQTAIMVMGIIGGILGILVSLLIVLGGVFFASVESSFATGTGFGIGVLLLGIVGIVLSVGGMVCSIITKKNPLICGIVLCIAGVAGFFIASGLWTLTAILFIISGILVLVNMPKYQNS